MPKTILPIAAVIAGCLLAAPAPAMVSSSPGCIIEEEEFPPPDRLAIQGCAHLCGGRPDESECIAKCIKQQQVMTTSPGARVAGGLAAPATAG